MLTKENIQDVVGKAKAGTITDKMVDVINASIDGEQETVDLFVDNFLTYHTVLQSGRFTLDQYVNAIKFCSCKMTNMTDIAAYQATYPDRYAAYKYKLISLEGKTDAEFRKHIGVYVHAVANGKLVSTILSQVQIPTKLLNMHFLQEAINVEAHLMHNAKSEIVKEKAANTLITYLGNEDQNRIQVDIGFKKDEVIDQYESAMKKMVEAQLDEIRKGGDVVAITNTPILEAEVVDE